MTMLLQLLLLLPLFLLFSGGRGEGRNYAHERKIETARLSMFSFFPPLLKSRIFKVDRIPK